MTAQEVVSTVGAAWEQALLRNQKRLEAHPYVYASQWRPCVRRMVYDMTEPGSLPPWTPDILARFRRGDDRERDLLADLTRIGRDANPPFAVVSQQERFELRDRKGRVCIVGKVDARLEMNGQRFPLEVKSWSPNLIAKVATFDNLFHSPWTRSGAYQLLAYLYGSGEPVGVMLLDRSGLPLLLPVELDAHLEQMEAFLSAAELARDHRDAGTLPDYHIHASDCQRCPFYGAICNPPLMATGTQVLTDPELEAALDRRESLKAAADEYDSLDGQVKRQLRGVESAIVGPFQITGKWSKSSRLELPEALKKQYTVSDPKGRFALEIVKL